MVKVRLVSSGKIVNKSWSNRRKYSKRSRLARLRFQRSVQQSEAVQSKVCNEEKQENNADNITSKFTNDTPAVEKHTNVLLEDNDYNFHFLSPSPNVLDENLIMEVDRIPQENKFPIEGNRIVDLSYLLNWSVNLQYNHTKECTTGKLYLKKEYRNGLSSTLFFECDVCHRSYKKTTFNPNQSPSINEAIVWGTLAAGSTYGCIEELFSVANIKFMSRFSFNKIENNLSKSWKDYLWLDMERAGKLEREEAIKRNQIDEDNVPWITVMVDGGWSKRSYGHNFNAKSGVAIIIGRYTKKCLYVGIRNKYCSVCSRSTGKGVATPEHICFKNWEGSSSGMESDILVEGFRLSEKMHGLRFKQFIGDGDSNVYAKLRQSVTYGREIKKVECTNHVVKSYGKNLYKLANDTKFPVAARKLLNSKNIKRLEGAVKGAIEYNARNGNVAMLQKDLENGPCHVFGNHSNCRDYFCDTNDVNLNHTEYLKDCGLWQHIITTLELVIRKAPRLLYNETNNLSETYMNIVSRFNSGKRLNLISRGSFQRRCYLSALRFNSGVEWHSSPWKRRFGSSPGKITKSYIKRQVQQNNCRKARRALFSDRTNRKKPNNICVTSDSNYGPAAEDVEIEGEALQAECIRKLQSLQVSGSEIDNIAKKTVGQFGNVVFESERRDRLTASLFGRVIKRKCSTSCHNLVKDVLYPKEIKNNYYVDFGKANEKIAIQNFEKLYDVTVYPSGLYIDSEDGFLACSPDGLLGENYLIEVKCVPSIVEKGITLEKAAAEQKNFCLEILNGDLRLKRNHNYFYQIQGQLNICRRQFCYLIVFTSKEDKIFVEIIERDKTLWQNIMLPKLSKFYKDCILPEIILKRIPRNKKCKEPDDILVAIQKKKKQIK